MHMLMTGQTQPGNACAQGVASIARDDPLIAMQSLGDQMMLCQLGLPKAEFAVPWIRRNSAHI